MKNFLALLMTLTVLCRSFSVDAADGVCVTSEIESCIEYSDPSTCALCVTGKFPQLGGGQCVDCPSATNADCTACRVDDGVTKCAECTGSNVVTADGFGCEECETRIPGCKSCNQSYDGSLTCASCFDERKPSEDGLQCVYCPEESCSQCSDYQVCSVCNDPNTFPTGGPGCDACTDVADSDCTSCTNAGHVTRCTTCADDLVAVGLQCQSCGDVIPDCEKCSQHSDGTVVCLICGSGKRVSNDASKCVVCEDETCKACAADDICSTCSDSTHLFPSGHAQCDSCQSVTDGNCIACRNEHGIAKCTACSDGHVVTEDGTGCQACSDRVKDCVECKQVANTVVTCNKCRNSKVPSVDGSKCVSCPDATCEKCSRDAVCSICVDKDNQFPVRNGQGCRACESVIDNCIDCDLNEDGETICIACNIDTFPARHGKSCGECSSVFPGCRHCGYNTVQQKTICKECSNSEEFPSPNGCCGLCAGVIGGCLQCVVTSSGDTICQQCINAVNASTACMENLTTIQIHIPTTPAVWLSLEDSSENNVDLAVVLPSSLAGVGLLIAGGCFIYCLIKAIKKKREPNRVFHEEVKD